MGVASIRRDPAFRRFWLGESITFLGGAVRGIALPLTAVLYLDADPVQMGLLVTLQTLPTLFVSMLAGVYVDRVRRRPILVGCNAGRALLLLTVPVLAWRGSLAMPHLYAVSFALGGLAVLSTIAARAYLPWLLPPQELVAANSRLEVSHSVAHLGGQGLGGWLVSLLTAPVALLLDSIALLSGALCFARIPRTEPTPQRRPRRILADIREGLAVVFRHPLLRPIVLCGATHNFCSQMIVAVQILYMFRVLRIDPGLIGIVLGASGPGALLGAAAAPRFAHRLGLGRTLLVAQLLTGIARLAIPLAGGPRALLFATLLAAEFTLGFARPLFNVNQISLRQRAVDGSLQGRVNASFAFVLWGVPPLGAAAGGLLASFLGMRESLFVASIGVAAAAAFVQWSPLRKSEA